MSAILHKDETRFLATSLDGEIVLLDLQSATFLTLKDSAVRIWELIDGTRDRNAILVQVQDDFNGPADRIARELDTFLGQLRDAGFVM